MELNIQKLMDDVAAEVTVVDGMAVLLGTVKAQLDAALPNVVDPATKQALAQLSVQLEESTTKAAAAILKNTPQDPGTAPAGDPAPVVNPPADPGPVVDPTEAP